MRREQRREATQVGRPGDGKGILRRFSSAFRAPRITAVAALLLVLLASCGSRERRLEDANTLRHAGKPKEALGIYRTVLAEMGDGPLGDGEARLRVKALKYAAEISYLELGDYPSAVAYYRRIVSLQPATPEAFEARSAIGDIYRDRFNDPLAAIAQYADIAARDVPGAPQAQLKVARAWLELKNFEQARTEARAVRERWLASPEADEAQLLTAQAWASEGRAEEALGAYRALVERRPSQELVARALEGQALLFAQEGRYDRALELYAQALPIHPNPEAIRTNIEAVARRREAAKTAKPGDRSQAFDWGLQPWRPPKPGPAAPSPIAPPSAGEPASSAPAPASPTPTPSPSPTPQEPRP
jgi:tetratricopeptide (TPR) repeat protein